MDWIGRLTPFSRDSTMTTASRTSLPRLRYHPNAYRFVFDALRYTQECLDRIPESEEENENAHISGAELLEGIRDFALEKFGLLSITVFRHWGIRQTDDFGRIVFELVERGDMRKTDQDHQADFAGVYEFNIALDEEYEIDTDLAFV